MMQVVFLLLDINWLYGELPTEVKPPVSDHPKYKAKAVPHGKWSLTRGQNTESLNFKSYGPYEPVVSAKYYNI